MIHLGFSKDIVCLCLKHSTMYCEMEFGGINISIFGDRRCHVGEHGEGPDYLIIFGQRRDRWMMFRISRRILHS